MQPPFLLFGGTSSEARVSVASAQNILSYLPAAIPLFIAHDGNVHRCAAAELRRHERPFETDFVPPKGASWPSLQAMVSKTPPERAFFLALHGGDGENGTVQQWLQDGQQPFTASAAAASALAFDKDRSKQHVATVGIRSATALRLEAAPAASLAATLRQRFAERGPLLLKPVADGSSVGVLPLRDAAAIEAVAAEVARAARAYLAEDFLLGTEITVGVIETPDGRLIPLPPTEVRLDSGRSFDFAGKYLGQGSHEITPAEVSPEVTQAAQHIAVAAHRSLGCYGYSRTDMISSASGVIFLELNTLPGLTRASFVPQQLAAAGLRLHDFLEQQLALAYARRPLSGEIVLPPRANCGPARAP